MLLVNAPDGSWFYSDDYRGTNPAITFQNPQEGLYDEFCARFPYEETEDQQNTIDAVLDDQPERYLTAEKKDVSVDFFVKWRIVDVATYYRAASGGNEEAARQRLTPIVKNALRNEINQRTLQEVVSAGRAELSGNFLEAVNRGAQSLGIEVVDVRIKRINLPDDSNILRTVYSRMSTERTQVANQLRAEGVEQSETIRSEADRQRQVTIAEAERDAQKLRGEGDARAAEIAAAAYGQDAEFYAFYRSLEAYRESMADGQTVLVLDPDSEFLRYMENSGR